MNKGKPAANIHTPMHRQWHHSVRHPRYATLTCVQHQHAGCDQGVERPFCREALQLEVRDQEPCIVDLNALEHSTQLDTNAWCQPSSKA